MVVNANQQQYAQPTGGVVPPPTLPFGASGETGSANFPQQQQYAVPHDTFYGQAPAAAHVQARVGHQPPLQYGYQALHNVGSNDFMDF